jgi:hypothetical protein
MSGAFRCASIADGHQWLDCYYGVAQPMRAHLGLSPAPAAQQKLASAPPPGGAVPPDQAEARNAVMSGAFSCAGTADDRSWLDCYYGAAQPMRAQLGLSPATQSQTRLAASTPAPARTASGLPATPKPKSNGGLMQTLFGDPTHALISNARVTGYKFDSNGMFTVTLANGEVWAQEQSDSEFAHWAKPASRYAVNIYQGAFSSYNLEVVGEGGSYKVVRTK